MTAPLPDGQVKVEQVDREAADGWRREWEHCRGSHTALVQAFARHRLSAIAQLTEERDRLRASLEAIVCGTYPRPVGKSWFPDAGKSKHDQCTHGVMMYEVCENCLDAFVEDALGARIAALDSPAP
jgi:hypothetical protein